MRLLRWEHGLWTTVEYEMMRVDMKLHRGKQRTNIEKEE